MAEPRLGDTTVQYELMFGRQAMARIRACPVGYLPLGCPERHGDHLPMGLDAIKAHRVCCRAAEALGGTVFPADPYAGIHGMTEEQLLKYSGEWGNLYTDATARDHLIDVVHQIARTGIKTLVIYSGHYPKVQVDMIEAVRRHAEAAFGIRVITFCESMLVPGDHAGVTETSFLLAVAPELVDMTRIAPVNFQDHGWSDEKSPLRATRERGEADIAKIIAWLRDRLAG